MGMEIELRILLILEVGRKRGRVRTSDANVHIAMYMF